MKTIRTSIVVDQGHTTTLRLPVDVEPGAYQVTLMIEDRPIGPKSDPEDFPVQDVGPWPEGLSLGHEGMYGDEAAETASSASTSGTLVDVFDARGRKMAEERREPLPEIPIVPIEYAGLWIAWDRDHTRIVASGSTIDEAYYAAIAAGEPEPILASAPDAEILFIGGIR